MRYLVLVVLTLLIGCQEYEYSKYEKIDATVKGKQYTPRKCRMETRVYHFNKRPQYRLETVCYGPYYRTPIVISSKNTVLSHSDRHTYDLFDEGQNIKVNCRDKFAIKKDKNDRTISRNFVRTECSVYEK